MRPDFDKAQEFTRHLAVCFEDMNSPDPAARDNFDAAFINSLFHHNWKQPYIRTELGDLSYQFIWPEVGEIEPTIPSMALDEIVFYHSGAQVVKNDGKVMTSLTPGDMLGLKLFNRRSLDWRGGWADPVDVDCYREGGPVEIGVPNDVMLPPLVARSLHYAMSLFGSTSTFEPRISLVRPKGRTKASDPSDLIINCPAFPPQELETQVTRYVHVVCRHAPDHIARRIFASPSLVIDDQDLVPLNSLLQEPKLVEGRLIL